MTLSQNLESTTRRDRRRQARRTALLDAAGRVLERLGLAMTMDDVAAEAGVSKGTLYLYFPSKDALLAGFAERHTAWMLPRLQARCQSAASGLDAIIAIVEEEIASFQEHPTAFRFLLSWLQEPNVEADNGDFRSYRGRLQDCQGMFLDAFERGKKDGSIRPEIDPVHHIMHVWSTTLGVMLMQHNITAVMQRVTVPVDGSRLVALHLDALRRFLAVDP